MAQSSGSGSNSATSPVASNAQVFGSNSQSLNGAAQDNPFKNLQGWETAIGGTPGASQGMTPGSEWEKVRIPFTHSRAIGAVS